ncbi:MAG: Zn-dependent hydrolase, partial [Acidobacteria bacterium]|nr:Zn-dependent hydrolase [Acidobacteriota bacterium]
ADLTRKEFEDYVTAHPEQREALLSGLTVVKRKGKELVAVPYHEEYARWLEPAAKELEAAAAASASASFRRYLTSKAKALRDDKYFQTDCDWIDLKDSPYELVLGPFEVYEDQLMGIKTSYEASVAVRDVQESTRLAAYIAHLQELEDNLPYPEADRRKVAGLASPMVVVRDIYRGGDLRVGYQAAATNLPNDPKVHEKKGSKKIFWKNVFEARVDKVILPISKELMEPSQAKLVTARGVFEDVLMHELCHALGPRYVRGTDEKVPVNQKLGDLYSAIEELKATVAGLVSMAWFFDQGIMPKTTEQEHYASYLGSILRAVRFGVGEAHGRASIVELNFLQERGAIRRDPATARWSVDASKMRGALRELTGQVLEIERAGDRAAAEALFAKYGSISPELAKDLERARSVPVEIEPIYRNLW